MSDIFDEVDEILKDVDLGTDDAAALDVESNFNEAELQDIMAEIENLEKEFEMSPAEASAEAADVVPAEIINEMPDEVIATEISAQEEIEQPAHVEEAPVEKKLNLQDEIDRELELSLEMNQLPPVAPSAEVFSFEKKAPVVPPSPSSSGKMNSEISFEAIGQMNLNLGFKIGDESARLSIDPLLGLVITMNGVELCINQEEGCKVTMENGVKFTIPLTSSDSALKKKSA